MTPSMVDHHRRVAAQKLQQVMDTGRERSAAMIEKLAHTLPMDHLVARKRIHFTSNQTGIVMETAAASGAGRDLATEATTPREWGLHSNALSQLNSRLRVPAKFARELQEEGDWGRTLLARNYTDLIGRRGNSSQVLVRSVGGQARAVLSDKYKRMDSGMILQGFVEAIQRCGAVAADAQVFDTRWAVSVLLPQTFEPVPGEVVGFGATLANSDFGNGALSYSFRILRLVCINGMVGQNELRKVHLGKELGGAVFSERTLQLQTKTVCSALDDVVSTSLSPARIGQEVERIREAVDEKIDSPTKLIAALQKSSKITKEEEEQLGELYVDADAVELPPGHNVWRMTQALASLAKNQAKAGKGERSLELERLSGDFMESKIPRAAAA